MKKVAKIMTGAVATAMLAVGAAAPAEAQYYRNRERGIDTGDVLTGIAVVGGVAAIASAIGNSNRGYGYNNGYGYNGGYVREGYGYNSGYGYNPGYGQGYGYNSGYGQSAAVNACSYRAQRYARGPIQILDVDQTGSRRFRVHGVIDGDGGYYNRGYSQRVGFSCSVRDNGRVTDFDLDRRRY